MKEESRLPCIAGLIVQRLDKPESFSVGRLRSVTDVTFHQSAAVPCLQEIATPRTKIAAPTSSIL